MLFEVSDVAVDLRHLFVLQVSNLFVTELADVFGQEMKPTGDLPGEERCKVNVSERSLTRCLPMVLRMPNDRQPCRCI